MIVSTSECTVRGMPTPYLDAPVAYHVVLFFLSAHQKRRSISLRSKGYSGYRYGLSYGLYSYGLYSYGLCNYGPYSYGLYNDQKRRSSSLRSAREDRCLSASSHSLTSCEKKSHGSISASPTACPLHGYGCAGTQNDRLGERRSF